MAVEPISPEEARRRQQRGAVLVDVREPHERAAGMAEGALGVSLAEPGFGDRSSGRVGLPEVGEAGRRRLRQSRVAVGGAGGLGSPLAYYLAAAGVGTLAIAADDVVERSNLQRQILHAEGRIGMP